MIALTYKLSYHDFSNGLRIVIVTEEERRENILRILGKTYPEARTALEYETVFQLLVAVILSAQCTDVRVNQITAKLFQRYRTPADFAALTAAELEPEIRSCGLARAKARHIVESSQILVSSHGSQVPDNFEALLRLPGVGRKTANVMLANAFARPAIAVDTHVFRVSHRLGLARSASVKGTEQELQAIIPKAYWSAAHHQLIWHGRRICHAKKPDCPDCPLLQLCPTGRALEENKKRWRQD
ncbi:MAG: endonuclease III [Cyanobacteria bacterium NC_groundwater_1444_Ag_S-0.65um_54_12]|nr:endonuclease III [Cyanobacteria bacterium NC_groundwater_1444_Ag_S-0.65um_54_12]